MEGLVDLIPAQYFALPQLRLPSLTSILRQYLTKVVMPYAPTR